MAYFPNILSITSDIGVNSDNVIAGGNWSVDTYTGSGEENDYAYVGVNLQVDEAGTLYFDFSQDGTNWSTYPVNGFSIASGINEVHTAWKGGRYMRPRFVGTGGRSYFRLKTYYSNLPLPLSAPVDQSISSDQDATIVRAVGLGQIPDDTFINIPADGAGFRTTSAVGDGATFDSGVLDLNNYTQVGTSIVADVSGTMNFVFGNSPTMSGTTAGQDGVDRVITVPYNPVNGYQYFSAPAFTPYVRYEFTNTAGQGAAGHFFFDTRFLTKSVSGQLLRMDGFIAPSMVANLGRNVIVGTLPNGNFSNVSVTETANDSGTFSNLNVVAGARPSQLEGRVSTEVVVDLTTSGNAHTVTTDKTYYVTDLLLTVDNSDASNYGRINLRDSTASGAGTLRFPFLVQESPQNESAVQVITHTFVEPIPFSTGVYFDFVQGTMILTGFLNGYEE